MFFQGIIYIILILGFVFGIWKLVIKPLLKGAEVENLDEKQPDPLTVCEMKRDTLKIRLDTLKRDAVAAEEMASYKEAILILEHELDKVEKKIKEMK
jgi:hypothetical protein